jgi:hypothetical protein
MLDHIVKRLVDLWMLHFAPDDETLLQAFGLFEHLLTRQFQPLNKLKIEKINGEKASSSGYLSAMETMFDVVPEYKEITLYKKYEGELLKK